MQIPRELPEFKDKSTLLVVIGHHHGLFYSASNGELEKIDDIKIEEPEHSDNEGLFKKGGSGDNYTFGSVLESNKGKYEKEFSKSVAERVLDYSKNNDLDQIYLFYPQEMKHYIEEDWNEDMKKIITARFDGNYTKEHPTEIIKMIEEKRQKDDVNEPTGEAKEILEKFDD